MCTVRTTTIKGRHTTVVVDLMPHVKDFWSVVSDFEQPLIAKEDLDTWDRDGAQAFFQFNDGSTTVIEYT